MPTPASAPGLETNLRSQKAEQMKAPFADGGAGGSVAGALVPPPSHVPCLGQLPGLPGHQRFAWLARGSEDLFSFESSRER